MSNSGLEDPSPQGGRRASRFFAGVLWNWVGVALNIAIGLLLSPYIIRKLGPERYGIWALVFTLVEYLWFFDLGFNTSVTQFVAKYRARNEPDQINRVINTGLVYFCCVALVFALATLLVHQRVGSNSIIGLDDQQRIVAFLERPDESQRRSLSPPP